MSLNPEAASSVDHHILDPHTIGYPLITPTIACVACVPNGATLVRLVLTTYWPSCFGEEWNPYLNTSESMEDKWSAAKLLICSPTINATQ